MADILIRMEMPRNCFECPLFTNCDACEGHECGCGLLGGIGYEEDISKDRRRDDCPLQELPEHGDLIDRDALIKTCNEIIDEDWNAKAAPYSWSYAYESFVDDIVAIPVIVSASKEETE